MGFLFERSIYPIFYPYLFSYRLNLHHLRPDRDCILGKTRWILTSNSCRLRCRRRNNHPSSSRRSPAPCRRRRRNPRPLPPSLPMRVRSWVRRQNGEGMALWARIIKIKDWSPGPLARTVHSFACFGLLASLAPSAALTRSLARSLRSHPCSWDSE